MKKVIFVITKNDTGGAQKYARDLAGALPPDRFAAKILYGGEDIRWLTNATYPLLLFVNDWIAVFELVRMFSREKPDIIHLNSSKAGVLGALAAGIYNLLFARGHKSRVKVVFTAHGWVFNPTNHPSTPVKFFYACLHKIAALLQDRIINVSEYDRHLALRHRIASPEKLITIRNGIDPNIPFLNKELARQEILKKLPVTSYQLLITSLWIGSIGRLTPEKNYETLIRAARATQNMVFFIIGSGAEQKKLESLIQSESLDGRFFIVRPTGNDALLLKAFDIFAMTSIKEGLPYTLLEAMAAGLPAVITRAGGMPEIVENKCGIVVPQKDPRAFALALKNMASQPALRARYRASGRELILKELNLDIMAEKTAHLYSAIILR